MIAQNACSNLVCVHWDKVEEDQWRHADQRRAQEGVHPDAKRGALLVPGGLRVVKTKMEILMVATLVAVVMVMVMVLVMVVVVV